MKMKLPALLLLCAAGGGALVACRDQNVPVPTVENPGPAATPSAAPPTAGGEVPDGTFAPKVVGDAMGPFKRDLEGNSPDAHLRALNAALTFWLAAGRPLPKDLYELVAAKLLPRIPAPPPGKRFAIDGKSLQVVMVD